MTTTAIRAGKRIALSVTEKAASLEVIDIRETGVLAVRSDSNPENAYAVRHNGKRATGCPCESRVKCSHMFAVERYLALASDERAHVEDSIRAGGFEWASCYACGYRVRHEGYCHHCV